MLRKARFNSGYGTFRMGQKGPVRSSAGATPRGSRMRDYTRMEKLKITAGALSAVVIVGWLALFAFALLSTP
jgi:hypothetical protein